MRIFTYDDLIPIFHICEDLVLIFYTCEDLVPILHTCEDLVPILYICENMLHVHVSILHIVLVFHTLKNRSGRVLDSRPKGRGFEPHWRHCAVVIEQDTFILA